MMPIVTAESVSVQTTDHLMRCSILGTGPVRFHRLVRAPVGGVEAWRQRSSHSCRGKAFCKIQSSLTARPSQIFRPKGRRWAFTVNVLSKEGRTTFAQAPSKVTLRAISRMWPHELLADNPLAPAIAGRSRHCVCRIRRACTAPSDWILDGVVSWDSCSRPKSPHH